MTNRCAPGSAVTPSCGRQATLMVPSSDMSDSPRYNERSTRLNGQSSRCAESKIINDDSGSGRLHPNTQGSRSHWSTYPISAFGLSLPTILILFLTLFTSGAHSIQLAERNGLLYDSNPAPAPLLPHLVARGKSSTSSLLSPTQATFTLIPSNAIAAATSDPTNASQTNLPQPFDTSLGNNFTTASCPNFFRSFLNDKDFKQCYPFSLLLQTSTSFFAVEKSFFRTTQTLDVSCSVNFPKCSSLMAGFANKIKLQENCAADYAAQNPLVMQAYNGLSSYVVMFQAGCQKDRSGDYCFANAITNITSSADSYPYFLPLGMSLTPGTRQTCSTCLRNTMQVFAAAASNSSQLVSKTYPGAAEQINTNCGAEWLQVNVPISSIGRRDTVSSWIYGTVLATMLGLLLAV